MSNKKDMEQVLDGVTSMARSRGGQSLISSRLTSSGAKGSPSSTARWQRRCTDSEVPLITDMLARLEVEAAAEADVIAAATRNVRDKVEEGAYDEDSPDGGQAC